MKTSPIDIVLVHHDLGASKPGASKGPSILWQALEKTPLGSNFVSHIYQKELHATATTFTHAKHIDLISQTIFEISERIKANMQRDRSSLVIAGDHSTAAGTIAGIKKAHPDKRIGIVWFDAHADIHSPHTSPSGNMHGMPLAIVTDQDNTINRINKITEAEHIAWEDLQALSVITPAIYPRDIAFIGIRDLEAPEKKLLNSQGSLNLYAHDINNLDVTTCITKILEHLKDCDYIYVSFDIDCLDASEVPGTGTPVDKGPSTSKVIEICKSLLKRPETVCFELAEYNPLLDQQQKTKDVALKLLKQIFDL
ncbi:MAG: arginase [Bdellovibrionota bacterium]|nr:arginase [Deltaproteobacteria bacterium]